MLKSMPPIVTLNGNFIVNSPFFLCHTQPLTEPTILIAVECLHLYIMQVWTSSILFTDRQYCILNHAIWLFLVWIASNATVIHSLAEWTGWWWIIRCGKFWRMRQWRELVWLGGRWGQSWESSGVPVLWDIFQLWWDTKSYEWLPWFWLHKNLCWDGFLPPGDSASLLSFEEKTLILLV
jgi:hypothetical protein